MLSTCNLLINYELRRQGGFMWNYKDFVRQRSTLLKLVKIIKGEGYKLLLLDYPFKPKPRYGYKRSSHQQLLELIKKNKTEYEQILKNFLKFKDKLLKIPLTSQQSSVPYWLNGWLPGLDFVALYSFFGIYKPRRYFEVGSGLSTKLARKAIEDFDLSTKIISIDPEPREEINSVCDISICRPLEEVDLKIFKELKSGDFLFIDGSHRSFMNSDVTVIFLDILPKLEPGVLLQFHDIFLPDDYPPGSEENYYNEQYLLAAYLLADKGREVEIVFPSAYISHDRKLSKVLDPLWKTSNLKDVEQHGGSFWVRIKKS